jgi:VanZ family protein
MRLQNFTDCYNREVLMKPALATETSPTWVPWIPALLWLGIIALESTDLLSATHTLSLVHRVLALFQLHIDPQTVVQANAVLRKFGHFVGYAVLSWLLFRAWRATLPRPAAVRWALRWAVLAFQMTVAVASVDEWHQTSIPSRNGEVKDVVLDSAGAAAAQCLILVILKD